MTEKPSLPALERLVVGHRNADALLMALNILELINRRDGGIKDVPTGAVYSGENAEDAAVVFATRFADAFGRLLTDPDSKIATRMYEHISIQHRWIDLIYSLSGFRSSDGFISLIADNKQTDRMSFEGASLLRLFILLTTNSRINVDLNQLWQASPPAAAVAFLSYLTSRYVLSRRAFELRERLLEWLPSRLMEVTLSTTILTNLPAIYMLCSYAFTTRKHEIKRPLMAQVRRASRLGGGVE
jgi:hypothetical protein